MRKTVGVREAKARLSEILRDVERGHVVRVTSRGRTVAEIGPPRDVEEHHAWLIRTGRLTPASAPEGPLPRRHRASISASNLIVAERDEER